MAITIKNDEEIELMRKAGQILARVHADLAKELREGISTKEIDRLAYEMIFSHGGIPNFLNYNGFPASVCVSVNDEVVHGIPSEKRFLQSGDIVSIDGGVLFEGYHSDAARTYGIGEISEEARKLIEVTEDSFFEAIKKARPGNHIVDIGKAVQAYALSNGYSVVRDLTGHGIGTQLHEAPNIPNYKTLFRGPRIRKGMTLAVEPMINMGNYSVTRLEDNWTYATADGTLSAHYENTIAITENGCEILTMLPEEQELKFAAYRKSVKVEEEARETIVVSKGKEVETESDHIGEKEKGGFESEQTAGKEKEEKPETDMKDVKQDSQNQGTETAPIEKEPQDSEGEAAAEKEDPQDTREEKPAAAKEDSQDTGEKKPAAAKEDSQDTGEKKPAAAKEDSQDTRDEKPAAAKEDSQDTRDEKPAAAKEDSQDTREKKLAAAKEDSQDTREEKPAAAQEDSQDTGEEKPASEKEDSKDTKTGTESGEESRQIPEAESKALEERQKVPYSALSPEEKRARREALFEDD